MKKTLKAYKRGHLKAWTSEAVLTGNITYDEYVRVLHHLRSCKNCAENFSNVEMAVRSRRPFCPTELALNAPLKRGCLSIQTIQKVKERKSAILDSLLNFAVSHICVCPRCYAIYRQFGDLARQKVKGGGEIVVMPINTVVEANLIDIMGKEKYDLLKKSVGLEKQHKICDQMYIRGTTNLGQLSLNFQKGKDGKPTVVGVMIYEEDEYYDDFTSINS